MAVTLKQLAELSGSSIRTVSRVLNHQAHVQEEKRKKILELAREYHYIPNMAARNLRLNRSRFVGILCSRTPYEVFRQKLEDLETRLESRGCYPVTASCDGSKEAMEKILTDWSGLADFVVVSLFEQGPSADVMEELFRRFPLTPIYVDQEQIMRGHSLSISRAEGIRDAITLLIRQGRKKILRCGSLKSRETGLKEAFEGTARTRRPELLQIPADGTFETGYRLAGKILETGADAVFFDTDRMALGFLNYAAEHNIRIPEQIAVIGFDDDLGGRLAYPSLSTVAHPMEELNEAILSIIENRPEKPVHQTFKTRFIHRKSS